MSAKYLAVLHAASVVLTTLVLVIYVTFPPGMVDKSLETSTELSASAQCENYSRARLGPGPSDRCLLIILVLTRPDALERRMAIRNSWMRDYGKKQYNVLVKFSIGTKGLLKQNIVKLANEHRIYGDLLLLKDLVDSYSNLTRKVLSSFKEIKENYSFQYLLKCDDDSFLVLDVIVNELEQRNSTRSYYWGKILPRNRVLKSGKYQQKNWFLSDHYLPYAIGAGYVLSSDIVTIISTVSSHLSLYHNEDTSVGVWISPYNIERRHDNRICELKAFKSSCQKPAIVLNPISAKDMLLYMSNMTNNYTEYTVNS